MLCMNSLSMKSSPILIENEELRMKNEEWFGSWFLVLGSWFLVLGSWFLVLGSWFLVLGSSKG